MPIHRHEGARLAAGAPRGTPDPLLFFMRGSIRPAEPTASDGCPAMAILALFRWGN